MGRHAKEIIREEKVDITPCQPGTQKGLKRGEKNHLVKMRGMSESLTRNPY
jgi:hypothetical protein